MRKYNTCDVCHKESANVRAGNWVFYCSDNEECKNVERKHVYENEIAPSCDDGVMPDPETLMMFI